MCHHFDLRNEAPRGEMDKLLTVKLVYQVTMFRLAGAADAAVPCVIRIEKFVQAGCGCQSP